MKEITEQYPNIDISEFLQQKLQIPPYKAEVLAARIKKQYCQKSQNKKEQNFWKSNNEIPGKSKLAVKASSYLVESLSEKEFKHFIKWLFEESGYEIISGDFSGFDFVVAKDGEKIAVQARRYPKAYRVSHSIVLTSEEARCINKCQKSIVIATAYFTPQAIDGAQKLGIDLWDRDVLNRKIDEVRKNASLEAQSCFPQYKGSLLQSLLKLDETKDFIIEPKAGGKYDLYLPEVQFPLLTFQAHSNVVIRCVYRIKNNQPVGEFDGIALIGSDRDNNRLGPDDARAYALIIQYLEQFLEP